MTEMTDKTERTVDDMTEKRTYTPEQIQQMADHLRKKFPDLADGKSPYVAGPGEIEEAMMEYLTITRRQRP